MVNLPPARFPVFDAPSLTQVSALSPGMRNAAGFVGPCRTECPAIEDPQADVIAMMTDPRNHGGSPVERIDTHISHIFLAGDRAWKMKRAVRLPYVDFSTPALRLAACRREVELNSMTAPGLYLGCHAISRRPGGELIRGEEGELLDAVVEMRRFDQAALLDRMAVRGDLDAGMITRVACMIADFHAGAPVGPRAGGADRMSAVLKINEAGFWTSGVFDDAQIKAITRACTEQLERHRTLLDRRASEGLVRRCHGDLHLRNICLLDGGPRLFDCIEFNDELATTDVLYDLAFLLMDLWHCDLRQLANLAANRYLDVAGHDEAYVLLPFLIGVRAAVRAHVSATQSMDGGPQANALLDKARSYLALAHAALESRPAILVAIGGLSGAGKSTLADALAPHLGSPPGARIVESDRIRKALHGAPAEARLPADAYRAEVSVKVYESLAERSRRLLGAGASVVCDAVFERASDRGQIEAAARVVGAAVHGFWLRADPSLLRTRVAARRGGASDATVEVLDRQLARDPGEIAWITLDAALPVERNARMISDLLASHECRTLSGD
jgi:aminoglycoside phosphotransferase family enzyme/predicted kinase